MWYIHWFTYISETLCKCILLTDMFLCSVFKGAFCWYFIHGPPYAAPCDTPQATLRMKGPEDVSAVCWIQQPRSEILSSQFVVSDLNIEQSWFQQISFFLGQILQLQRFKNSAGAISMYQQIRSWASNRSENPYWVWFDSSFLQQPSPSMTLLTMTFYQIMPPQAPRTHLFYSLVCFCWEQITCLVTTWTGT